MPVNHGVHSETSLTVTQDVCHESHGSSQSNYSPRGRADNAKPFVSHGSITISTYTSQPANQFSKFPVFLFRVWGDGHGVTGHSCHTSSSRSHITLVTNPISCALQKVDLTLSYDQGSSHVWGDENKLEQWIAVAQVPRSSQGPGVSIQTTVTPEYVFWEQWAFQII